ncbi:MAG: hypothetical protein HOV81_31175 [Kofleriaceae bacterium]|nr:hypothetical protein [Kofleriaceae bacterium]
MRALIVSLLVVAAGCGSDVLDNTAYRRVVDQFDTYDQCLAEGDFARCYDTLTFCADGRVNANLEFRQEGSYEVHESEAIAKLPTVTVFFDLEKASSSQLPGRHPWEIVEPLYYDCAR